MIMFDVQKKVRMWLQVTACI